MAASRLIMLFILTVICCPEWVLSQGRYTLSPGPDLWYNTVDGIRAGIRLKGQMAGTFGDGPHRLDAGLWIGSKLPKEPVSYFVSFTEPIPSLSDFGSEASIESFSSIREGYHLHGAAFNKRWQQGFNESEYIQLRLTSSYTQRFNTKYAPIPSLWQSRPVFAFEPSVTRRTNVLGNGSMYHSANMSIGFGKETESFAFTQIELEQQMRIPIYNSFVLGNRIFLGFGSNDIPIERRYRLSSGKAIETIYSGVTRSRGTLPQKGINAGWIHIADGPNLRGYGRAEMTTADGASPITWRNVAGLNLELDTPNPVSWALSKVPFLGGLLNSRMYAFSDSGLSLDTKGQKIRSDAGAGFSIGLNIPDYLGRNRTIALRYDVPVWLSHPVNDSPHWKYRSVVGIWSVISW